MKKYTTIIALATASLLIANAQTSTVGVSVTANTQVNSTSTRPATSTLKKNLIQEKVRMHASNTEDRKELHTDTHMLLKNATSAEDRKDIKDEAKEKRENMRESNKDDRKELNERFKDLFKNKMSKVIQKLDGADAHLQNALVRINTYIDTYNASSTNTVKISKTSSEFLKLIASAVASHSAVLATHVYASTTISTSTKELAKVSIKAAQDALKTFKADLKVVTKDLIASYDLKAGKK